MLMMAFTYNQHFVAMMNVINAARLNPPAKGHKHHIVPKCWFKMNGLEVDNSNDNLVKLSYDDHIKVHMLMSLCAANPRLSSKMKWAVHRLSKGTFLGMSHTDETKELIRERRALQVISDLTKEKISKTLKGKPKPQRSQEHCKHLSEANTGKAMPDSIKEKIAISNRHPKKPTLNYKLTWGKLSEDFKKYTANGGTLKWHDWLHLRKERTDGK